MQTKMTLCVWLLAVAVAHAATDSPVSWLDSEKVRAAYHYGRPPVRERLERLRRSGINCIILKCSTERALPWTTAAGEYGIRCFLAFNFNASADKEGFRHAVLDTGVTEAYACPLDRRFWGEYLTPALLERAQLAAQPDSSVSGLWIDFELYSTKTGQRYYTRACYCDHCLKLFCEHKQVAAPELAADGREEWLTQRGWTDEYQPFLQTHIETFASELRRKVHAVAPNFLLGFYPTPHNWSLIGVARGFATDRVPILLWATDTYSGGGENKIPGDWSELYARQGINARYIAGMLLRCYSARNLAANLYHATQACDGYWLFTTFTLNRSQETHKGDYYLAAGTPDEYWQAIERGNTEIRTRLTAGPAFRSQLAVGPEPVPYPAIKRPELRRRLLRLVPPDAHAATPLPVVRLRGPNVLVLAARQDIPVDLELAFHPIGGGREAISWRVVDLEGNSLAEGAGPKAASAGIRATPPHDGLLFVVASAGASCWSVAQCSVPFGLYAGTNLHLMHGENRLFVRVPAGAEEITIYGKGGSARETVRLELLDAAGRLVSSSETDAEKLEVTLEATVEGHAGDTWSVRLRKAGTGIFEDHFVRLPPPLPPVLALVPEYAFSLREQ